MTTRCFQTLLTTWQSRKKSGPPRVVAAKVTIVTAPGPEVEVDPGVDHAEVSSAKRTRCRTRGTIGPTETNPRIPTMAGKGPDGEGPGPETARETAAEKEIGIANGETEKIEKDANVNNVNVAIVRDEKSKIVANVNEEGNNGNGNVNAKENVNENENANAKNNEENRNV